VLIGLALLTGILLALAYTVHFRGKWAVARYERQIVAAGEPLEVSALYPPVVFAESNGAPLFQQTMGSLGSASRLLETNSPPAMQMVAPGRAMVGCAQPDIRAGGTNTWDEVNQALARCADSLDLVREAARHPTIDFELDYRVGYNLLLPHLAPLKQSVRLLAAESLCDLHAGHATAATTNIQAMLALAKAMTDERLAISQLVRIAMAAISVNATWELLQSPDVKEEDLATVQREWAGMGFMAPARQALEMERAMNLMMLRRMRRSGADFRQVLSLGGSSPAGPSMGMVNLAEMAVRETILGTKQASWRFSSSYPDQLLTLRGFQVLLDGFRAVEAGQPFNVTLTRQTKRLEQLGLHAEKEDSGRGFDPLNADSRHFFSGSVVSVSRVIHRVMAAETSRELVNTAVALKRYQLRHGQYPKELSALAPEFLLATPRDPADGQPLRYRVTPDGPFLLYSVGEDGVDNGGDASPPGKSDSFPWLKGRDVVWPSPATSEQVQAYQEKQARKRGG
jgi:hypothetical protein